MVVEAICVFVASGVAIGVVCTTVVLAIKWTWVQRFKPANHYLWSFFAIRNEALQHLFIGVVSKNLVKYLSGTPLLPLVLRLFGSKIGKRVFLATYDTPEFDCVDIGDYATINDCCLQTHTFEDRVTKIGRIKIGRYMREYMVTSPCIYLQHFRGAYVGSGSFVLYNTDIGEYAQIYPRSCVMIGESVNSHSRSYGNPLIEMSVCKKADFV